MLSSGEPSGGLGGKAQSQQEILRRLQASGVDGSTSSIVVIGSVREAPAVNVPREVEEQGHCKTFHQ